MNTGRLIARLADMLVKTAINNPGIFQSVAGSKLFQTEAPRSLNGCDRLVLPNIIRDFPDFDVTMVKNFVRQELKDAYGAENGFAVHNVVISQYLRAGAQKTVVLQAAFETKKGTAKQQRRATLHYTYLLSGSSETVAANCPNCGGALGYGVTVCPYCDSRVAHVLGNAWQFTQITED